MSAASAMPENGHLRRLLTGAGHRFPSRLSTNLACERYQPEVCLTVRSDRAVDDGGRVARIPRTEFANKATFLPAVSESLFWCVVFDVCWKALRRSLGATRLSLLPRSARFTRLKFNVAILSANLRIRAAVLSGHDC